MYIFNSFTKKKKNLRQKYNLNLKTRNNYYNIIWYQNVTKIVPWYKTVNIELNIHCQSTISRCLNETLLLRTGVVILPSTVKR